MATEVTFSTCMHKEKIFNTTPKTLLLKETGSRDGLAICRHAWIDLGINKVHGRFLNSSEALGKQC